MYREDRLVNSTHPRASSEGIDEVQEYHVDGTIHGPHLTLFSGIQPNLITPNFSSFFGSAVGDAARTLPSALLAANIRGYGEGFGAPLYFEASENAISPRASGPDLVISDVDVGSQDIDFGEVVNETFIAGETFSVTIDIRNEGDAGAGSSRAAVYLSIDGQLQLMDTNTTQSLAPGSRDTNETLSFNLPSNLEAGFYSVIVITDYRNDVVESDEDNNAVGFFINVVDGGDPDLTITDVDVGTQDIDFGETVNQAYNPGDPFSVTIDITNEGDGAAASSRAAVYLVVDGVNQLMDTNTTQSLDPGSRDTNETLNFTIPTDLDAGTYSILVITDYLNDVAESDENNNATGFFIAVEEAGQPDLIIANTEVGNQNIVFGDTVSQIFGAGDTFSVTIDIRNQGDGSAPASASAVYLVVDGENRLMGTNSTNSLDPGSNDFNENLSFIVPADIEAGIYSILVITDYQNAVDEADELNNGTAFLVNFADDYADEPGEAGTINGVGTLGVNDSISGWIGLSDANDDSFGDRDAFLVSLVSGRTYTFSVDGSEGLTDAVFSIRDSSFNRVGDLSTEGDPATLTFTAPSSGNFFVRVGTGVSGQTGAYTLSVSEEAAADLTIANVSVGLQDISFGDTVADAFDSGDVVDLTIDITNLGNADAQSSSAAVYLSVDGELRLLGTNTTTSLAAGSSDTAEALSFSIPTDLNAGIYAVLVVTDYLGAVSESDEDNNATGFFITVAGEVADDFADQPGDGGTLNGVGLLSVGSAISGVIGEADADDTYGDKDVFLVSLEAGQTYRIDLVAQDLPLGIFTVRDPSDFSNVLQVSRIGSSTSTEFIADVSGNYWIRIGTGGEPTDQGSYELSVSNITAGQSDDPAEPDPPIDDYADFPGDSNSINGIPTLQPGRSIGGLIDFAGDRDVFEINLVEGQSYQFSLENEARDGLAELPSVFMTIRSPNAFAEVLSRDGGGQQATITFDARETGTFFVRIGSAGTGELGGYRLSVEALGETPAPSTVDDDPSTDDPYEVARAELFDAIGEGAVELFLNDAAWDALIAALLKLDADQIAELAKELKDKKLFGILPIQTSLDVFNDVQEAVAEAEEGQEAKAFFVQLFDSLAETLLIFVPATFARNLGRRLGDQGGFAFSAAVGAVVDIVYDFTLSRVVESLAEEIFDNFSNNNAEAQQSIDDTDLSIDEAQIVTLDTAWYLETYPDALQALREGTAGSAYAHFVTVGIDLGYQPNAVQSLTREELVTELFESSALALGNSAILTLELGDYAGDGTSGAEIHVGEAINSERGTAGLLELDAGLTAFASRKANDLVANFTDSAINFAFFEGNSDWAEAWSNGNQLTQQFRGALESLLGENVDPSRYGFFAVSSQFGTPDDVLAQLQDQAGFNEALANSDFDTIGIAEFGGLWVVILADREPNYVVEAPSEDTLARTSQFGSADFDVLFGGLRSSTLYGFGGDDLLFGSNEVDILIGGEGNDGYSGGANVDTAVVSGNRSEYAVTQRPNGTFDLVGPDGTDSLVNVEFVQFDDEILRLLPGTGVSVNFQTADTAAYQPAMSSIRDFDGNALGGDGSWLRIGEADVNGDGDIDQILVNDAIGRFATVGTAPDGLVYFDDHSWAGETRVAGIYTDPLVESGDVVAGSDNDSQRRFQNDLEIENINRVLGADDYDGDGIQEVFFALTDGTAYLRALIHDDGNIRYANYQSEQEVIDYLTANGYDDTTFGDWFDGSENSSDTITFVADDEQDKQASRPTEIVQLPGGFVPHENDIEAMFAQRPSEGQWQQFDTVLVEFFG